MASYELSAFDRFNAITVVGAIEQQTPATLNVGFWVRDPNQFLIYPDQVKAHPRQDFLWEQIAAKYLNTEITGMLSAVTNKLEKSASMKM
jgi:hypothetical protein